MRSPSMDKLYGIFTATALTLALMSCNGGGGGGTSNPNPYTGPTTNITQLSASQWSALTLNSTVVSAAVSSGVPTVTVLITDASGVPVVGLARKDDAGAHYYNFGFGISKLVSGTPSRWVSYNVVTTPATGATADTSWPEAENTGTLKDNGDGTYTYTFGLDISKAQGYVNAAITDTTVRADLDDITYQSGLLHRVFMTVGGSYSTSDTTPVLSSANAAYDFYPSTGKVAAESDSRIIADLPSCNTCHSKLSVHTDPTYMPAAIQDTKLCVACHTEQMKYGSTESLPSSGTLLNAGLYGQYTMRVMGRALGNFPNMIHHIHRGEDLYYQGYSQLGLQYNEVRYPQQANCTKCHSEGATAQGVNWSTVPSRLACGACHDDVNFATGENHSPDNLIMTSDASCTGCHQAADIKAYHAWNDLSAQNTTVTAQSVSPQLGNFTYELLGVSLNSSSQPVFNFNIYLDGTKVTSFASGSDSGNLATANNIATGRVILNPNFQPISGYIGGPSFYVQYGTPQDGITTPADFNGGRPSVSLAALLVPSGSPKAGTLNYDSSNGYWTAVLTGDTLGQSIAYNGWSGTFAALSATPLIIPSGARMVTGMMNGSFTQVNLINYPYTAANPQTTSGTSYLASVGGLLRPAPLQILLASITGNTARRSIVDPDKCNTCHDRLGTKPIFHGGIGTKMSEATAAHASAPSSAATLGSGSRDKGTACAFCHVVNLTSTAWSANSSTFVHAIHGRSKRTVPFTWQAVSATENYGTSMTYPGVLRNCEQCHVPGSYDFSATANAAALPNLLWTTVATGKYNGSASSNATGYYKISPYVTADNTTNYGSGFSITSAGVTTQAASTTLVNSPITAACVSCHDDNTNVNSTLGVTPLAHMQLNGGAFYQARGTGVTSIFTTKQELCMTCHGTGKVQDIKTVHLN